MNFKKILAGFVLIVIYICVWLVVLGFALAATMGFWWHPTDQSKRMSVFTWILCAVALVVLHYLCKWGIDKFELSDFQEKFTPWDRL